MRCFQHPTLPFVKRQYLARACSPFNRFGSMTQLFNRQSYEGISSDLWNDPRAAHKRRSCNLKRRSLPNL
jgi:hypothetical protein